MTMPPTIGPEDIIRACRWPLAAAELAAGWGETVARFPDFQTACLEPEFIAGGCAYFSLSAETEGELQALARTVRDDLPLRALFCHAMRRAFQGGPKISDWPMLEARLGPLAGQFCVLLALSQWQNAREVHRQRRMPQDIVRATMADLRLHGERHARRHGAFGIDFLHAGGWFKGHVAGTLVQLGRLQYMPTSFPYKCRVYRNRDTGATVTLAEDGLAIRADGFLNGASGLTETDGIWQTSLRAEAAGVRGNPVDVQVGNVRREERFLPSPEWPLVLAPGDPVLDIHIPESGPLTEERCRASFAEAPAFFRAHFPEKPAAKALVCTTWLLDSQLTGMLRADSNIIRFLRLFSLVPAGCDAWAIFRFTFGLDIPYGAQTFDIAGLPRDTSLQRGILEHVETGGLWRKSGGYILLPGGPAAASPAVPQSARL